MRGKITQPRQWSTMGGSHIEQVSAMSVGSEIQVEITRPWLCSSERERLRGKSDDTSPPRIGRNTR